VVQLAFFSGGTIRRSYETAMKPCPNRLKRGSDGEIVA
jgi:hypothetical protein